MKAIRYMLKLFLFLKQHEHGYDKYWEDLPADLQEAAQVLGWDQELWDSDRKVSSETRGWQDLSPTEQEAATER